MDNDVTRTTERDRRLDEIVTAYLKAVEAGEHPEPKEWLERYPDLADELSGFFAGQKQVAALAGGNTIGFEGLPGDGPSERSATSAITNWWKRSPAAAWEWSIRPGRFP
jgi:hypothetical protein